MNCQLFWKTCFFCFWKCRILKSVWYIVTWLNASLNFGLDVFWTLLLSIISNNWLVVPLGNSFSTVSSPTVLVFRIVISDFNPPAGVVLVKWLLQSFKSYQRNITMWSFWSWTVTRTTGYVFFKPPHLVMKQYTLELINVIIFGSH